MALLRGGDKKHIKEKIKFYSVFNILISGVCLFLIATGFKTFYENASAFFVFTLF